MAALCEAFHRLRSGEIDSEAFEQCLFDSVLHFPCWDSPEQPARGWRLTEDGDQFNPMIVTRDEVPILPVFDDANQIAPWLARRGDSNLAKQLSFVTMHGRALVKSISDEIHVLIVLSDGSNIEIDREQIVRMRKTLAA